LKLPPPGTDVHMLPCIGAVAGQVIGDKHVQA
jgi:hypothetical protein